MKSISFHIAIISSIMVLGVGILIFSLIHSHHLRANSQTEIEQVIAQTFEASDINWTPKQRDNVIIAIRQAIQGDKKIPSRKRQIELLNAMEKSPFVKRLSELSGTHLELRREQIKARIEWFLNAKPPTPEEKRNILRQIDEVVEKARQTIRQVYPELNDSEIEAVVNGVQSNIMRSFEDELIPILKHPLSERELSEVETVLQSASGRIADLPRSVGLDVVFSPLYATVDRFYDLKPSKREEELTQKLIEEDKQRFEAEVQQMLQIQAQRIREIESQHTTVRNNQFQMISNPSEQKAYLQSEGKHSEFFRQWLEPTMIESGQTQADNAQSSERFSQPSFSMPLTRSSEGNAWYLFSENDKDLRYLGNSDVMLEQFRKMKEVDNWKEEDKVPDIPKTRDIKQLNETVKQYFEQEHQ